MGLSRAGSAERKKTVALAASVMLGALALAIDYTMKFTGAKDIISTPWRLAFPQLAFLKFDLDGIPLFCATAFFGLTAGGIASAILGLGIFARAPHLFGLVGGSMKALAEFSTSAGAYMGLRARRTGPSWASCILSALLARVLVMMGANMLVLPLVYQVPVGVALGLLPLIAFFNVIQGSITAILGLSVAQAVAKRAYHVLPEDAPLLAALGKPPA